MVVHEAAVMGNGAMFEYTMPTRVSLEAIGGAMELVVELERRRLQQAAEEEEELQADSGEDAQGVW